MKRFPFTAAICLLVAAVTFAGSICWSMTHVQVAVYDGEVMLSLCGNTWIHDAEQAQIRNLWKGGVPMRKLSDAEVRSYAGSIDAKLYPYFCAETGELAGNLWYVIRATINDWRRCRIRHTWQRTRNWQK